MNTQAGTRARAEASEAHPHPISSCRERKKFPPNTHAQPRIRASLFSHINNSSYRAASNKGRTHRKGFLFSYGTRAPSSDPNPSSQAPSPLACCYSSAPILASSSSSSSSSPLSASATATQPQPLRSSRGIVPRIEPRVVGRVRISVFGDRGI
jgi:hypothetical protein